MVLVPGTQVVFENDKIYHFFYTVGYLSICSINMFINFFYSISELNDETVCQVQREINSEKMPLELDHVFTRSQTELSVRKSWTKRRCGN